MMVGTLIQRKRATKSMWRDLSTRARLGEVFGFIDALALLYKLELLSREQVKQLLNQRVSKSDLAEYKRVRGDGTFSMGTF